MVQLFTERVEIWLFSGNVQGIGIYVHKLRHGRSVDVMKFLKILIQLKAYLHDRLLNPTEVCLHEKGRAHDFEEIRGIQQQSPPPPAPPRPTDLLNGVLRFPKGRAIEKEIPHPLGQELGVLPHGVLEAYVDEANHAVVVDVTDAPPEGLDGRAQWRRQKRNRK